MTLLIVTDKYFHFIGLDLHFQIHALSAGIKSYVTRQCMDAIEWCRLSCGGHGYSLASGIPKIYVSAVVNVTAEGEATVLMLQTARFVSMKATTTTTTIKTLNLEKRSLVGDPLLCIHSCHVLTPAYLVIFLGGGTLPPGTWWSVRWNLRVARHWIQPRPIWNQRTLSRIISRVT